MISATKPFSKMLYLLVGTYGFDISFFFTFELYSLILFIGLFCVALLVGIISTAWQAYDFSIWIFLIGSGSFENFAGIYTLIGVIFALSNYTLFFLLRRQAHKACLKFFL